MNIGLIANFSYIVAALLFIVGLKMLGSPATARRGNWLSSVGMLIAVTAGLFNKGIVTYDWIIIGMLIGAVIGATAARLVAMTSMPEMVALFNGFGGIASLLVGWAALFGATVTEFTVITICLAMLIGGLTFTGSLVAFAKLAEVINSKAYVFAGQRFFNALLLAAIIAAAVMVY